MKARVRMWREGIQKKVYFRIEIAIRNIIRESRIERDS